MKACPTCQSTYEDWIEFCFNDGVPLVAYEPKPPPAAARPSAPRPATPPPSSAFDAPDARLVSGADLPEPAHLSRFSAATSLDAPDPSLRFGRGPAATPAPAQPEPPTAPAAPADDLAPPTPLAAPLASPLSAPSAPVEVAPVAEAAPAPVAAPVAPAPIAPAVAESTLVPEPTTGAPPAMTGAPPVTTGAPPAPTGAPAVAVVSSDLDADAMNDIASALSAAPEPISGAPTRPFHPPLPQESEDAKATVPMYTAYPEEPRGRSALDDEPPRSKAGAAGLGVVLIGLLAFGALAVVAAIGIGWTVSRGDGEATAAKTSTAPAPAVLPAAATPPPPVAPVTPEPVVDPAATVAATAPAVATPTPAPTPAPAPTATARPATPAPTATASRTPTASTTTGANASTPAATTAGARSGGSRGTPAPAVVADAGTGAVTSDSVWGGTPTAPTSGFLRIVTDPDGATVYVNDAAKGKTPVTVELPYGAHQVRVVRAGYKTEVRDVNIRVRELTVPFNLKPEVVTGQVNVYGPDGFRVVVDGHDMGPMPVTVQVSEGVRQFKLVGPDGNSCNLPKEIKFKAVGRPETITLACP